MTNSSLYSTGEISAMAAECVVQRWANGYAIGPAIDWYWTVEYLSKSYGLFLCVCVGGGETSFVNGVLLTSKIRSTLVSSY